MNQYPHYPARQISTFLVTAFLALCIIQIVRADCPVSYSPRKTLSGSIIANIDENRQNQEHSYLYPLFEDTRMVTRPNVAVAVTGLSLDRKSQQFGYNIQTGFYQLDTIALIFKVRTGTSQSKDQWRFIEFKFVFSEAPEILTGTQNILEMIPTSDSNVFRISQFIPISSPSFNFKAQAKIFISGVQFAEKRSLSAESVSKIDETIKKIQSLRNYSWNVQLINRFTKILSAQKNPSLRLTQPEFTQNGILNFQIVTSQVQIRVISYSYLIYLQRTNAENMYRTISGSFSTADQERYAYNGLAHGDMTIFGMSGLSSSTDNQIVGFKVHQVEASSNYFFVPEMEGDFASFNLEFFGIEVLPGSVCKTCQGSPLLFQQFCVNQCPFGYAISINSDGLFQCSKCDIENFLISADGGGKCVCASGHFLISPTQSCLVCPYDCLTCNGYNCLTCDTAIPTSFRKLNPATSRCQCQAFNNRGIGLYDDTTAQSRICGQCNPRCRTCWGPLVNQCMSCSPSRTLINGMCRCNTNLVESSNTAECVCQSPYTLNQKGECVLSLNKCNENEILVTVSATQRTCNCASGYTRSIISNKCIKQCQSYQELNIQTQKCECREGTVRNLTSSTCYSCNSKVNQIYNTQTNKCQCLDGFEVNKAGDCILCPPKSYYNPSSDKCECIFNYYQISPNGPCYKCTPLTPNGNCRFVGGVTRTQLSMDPSLIRNPRS